MPSRAILASAALAAALVAAGAHSLLRGSVAAGTAQPPSATVSDVAVVQLTDAQLDAVTVATVADREFPVQTEAVGSIDFNEDLSVQVFPPYQGRILETRADLGDEVKRGQILFTIESPDFIAAQSTLIGAAATLDQTSSAFNRAKLLYADRGIDQNDYETAMAAQKTAEGALRAARNAVAVFGRTEAEIDRIIEKRQVEPALIVKSPINGRVTARNAAPGSWETPGNPPAPYSVADTSTVWMLANVAESDSPGLKVGQPAQVTVAAHPGRVFAGRITALGATVDPNTHRLTVRSEIKDPQHELRSGMFASFVIRTGEPAVGPAIPQNGVVREGDGTLSVWVQNGDRHRFVRRTVKIGAQHDGYDQVLDGLRDGEPVAVDGAIFLSNIAFGGAS